MTTLWKQDPFHGEWDLMCGTYSAIRPLLADQKITFQAWIAYAINPLGIVKRDQYMTAMGWTLLQDDEGSYKLEQTGGPMIPRAGKLMSGLNLLMLCLKGGLPVANPRQMIKILSNRSGDVMHIKTSTAATRAASVKTSDPLLAMARNNPTMAMSRLFEIPLDHAWVADGVQVRHINSFSELDQLQVAPGTSQAPMAWPAQQNTQQRRASQHTERGAQNDGHGSLYNGAVNRHENNGKSHGPLQLSSQSVC